ncbi:MAG: MmcQ/YjbR family DNA-binding protein [Campylobacteraceae bacterium]|nr:MmcQ/YjbR family DNA-binding protein [Campylobacteraceae bacterium]
MKIKTLEEFILNKIESIKTFPFTSETMVFKVKDKMFVLLSYHENKIRISLKCDPLEANIYKEIYFCIKEGYHLNKKHWISIYVDDSIKDEIVFGMINDSYDLVVNNLSKIKQKELKEKEINAKQKLM